MCYCRSTSFIISLVLLSITDCQYWGNYRRHGPPARPIACPDVEDESFSCVPNYLCPKYHPQSDKYYCHWAGEEPLVCCHRPTDEQGCGLVHGFRVNHGERILSAIVGGVALRDATTSPWMAAVGERLANGSIDWYCGGSLINGNAVLTAAHCVVRRKAQVVRVGDLDLYRRNEPNASPEDIPVTATSIHPDYKLPSYYNDIAVLHLLRAPRPSRYVKPVCMASDPEQTYTGMLGILTGWGHLEYGGPRSSMLREVSISVFNNTECQKSYAPPRVNPKNYPRGIIDSQLCAGDVNGGKDACQGDSGGPLVVNDNGVHTLIGIVSSGIGCGAKSFPGIYTRVSAYSEWVNNEIQTRARNKPAPHHRPPPQYNNNQQYWGYNSYNSKPQCSYFGC